MSTELFSYSFFFSFVFSFFLYSGYFLFNIYSRSLPSVTYSENRVVLRFSASDSAALRVIVCDFLTTQSPVSQPLHGELHICTLWVWELSPWDANRHAAGLWARRLASKVVRVEMLSWIDLLLVGSNRSDSTKL